MSEHIQPAPSQHHAPAALTAPEPTPGVAHESSAFNFRLIVWVGVGLLAVAVVMNIALWGLLKEYQAHHAPPMENASALAMEDAKRPLPERLLDMPPPHLEGIERESSLLVLRAEEAERRFYVVSDVKVRIDKQETSLFELREGQRVSVTYHMPGGVAGSLGIVTSVVSPPDQPERKDAGVLPMATRKLSGTILRIEPRSPADARAWGEAQMRRYEWVDRKKEIARIPITAAMEEVLQSKEFRSAPKKNEGRSAAPRRGGKR